jgi:hypothetical protein
VLDLKVEIEISVLAALGDHSVNKIRNKTTKWQKEEGKNVSTLLKIDYCLPIKEHNTSFQEILDFLSNILLF